MTPERLGPIDAAFLYAEDRTHHLHVGACAIFEGPAPRLDDVANLINSKRSELPRQRQRVRHVPAGLGRPVWIDDPNYDIAQHLHPIIIDEDRDPQALSRLVGRLMSRPLERDRPLWDTHLVEGLREDRWALISRAHHCMLDGISGIELFTAILDTDRDAASEPVTPWFTPPPPDPARLATAAIIETLRNSIRAVSNATRALSKPRQLASRATAVGTTVHSIGTQLVSATPPLSIHGPIGPDRTWAATNASLEQIRAIRTRIGGSVNDVVLTAVAGALGAFAAERGDTIDATTTVRALIPVSLRQPGDTQLNNQIAAVIADLPIGLTDARARFTAVRTEMERLKGSGIVEAGETLWGAADMMPAILLAGSARLAMEAVRLSTGHGLTTIVSNVPGPRQPLYALGRRLLDLYPAVPLGPSMRTGTAIISYGDRLCIAVSADAATVPDVDRLAALIADGFNQLERL